MGTRAAFWKGDPRNLKDREWLGCVAFDGYPEGIEGIEKVTDEKSFLELVNQQSARRDFASPKRGWPYPWSDDVFLTDFTYAFFDGKLQLSPYHHGFMTVKEYEAYCAADEPEDKPDDHTMQNVPAPGKYDPSQPDSIMIFKT